jgi:hypothetical protein
MFIFCFVLVGGRDRNSDDLLTERRHVKRCTERHAARGKFTGGLTADRQKDMHQQ